MFIGNIMKISKIPGLGRFGIFIDDLDLDNIEDEQWLEIGKLHLDSLVTILRNVKVKDIHCFEKSINKWGPSRFISSLTLYQKYGRRVKEMMFDIHSDKIDEDDRQTMLNARQWQVHRKYTAFKVTPKITDSGRKAGLFGDGELKWHSNECGDVLFTPCVSLLGRESMTTSCTGFVTSVDWYEEQTESFRSELDEMIIIHNFKPLMIDPTQYVKSYEDFYKMNMCPNEDSRLPLIIKSPGGIKGVHLGINTFDKIDGMSKEESDKIFEYIEKTMFVPKYTYEHWYQQDNDMCIFDNSITLHNRKIKDDGHAPDRLAWRIQHDYDYIAGTYRPFFQEEFNIKREERMRDLLEINQEAAYKME
jgi:alpha-ketoglutarate-dependent taurine dioxygenase